MRALRLPKRASAVAYWFAAAVHGSLRFRVRRSLSAAALPEGRRCLPGQGFAVPVARLPGSPTWTRMGSLRSSGGPSVCSCCVPRPRPNRCVLAMTATSMLPPRPTRRRLRQGLISGLTGAASAPAAIRFVFRIAAHTQGSLPAGRLGLYRVHVSQRQFVAVDGINGSKASVAQTFRFRVPTPVRRQRADVG